MNPGWRNIVFKPCIPKEAPDAYAELQTVRGRVASRWQKKDGSIEWEITVPSGCTGTVWLPKQDKPAKVGSGVHRFEWAE
jgi:alpha-L-rhamnosidase